LELRDHSESDFSAVKFFDVSGGRDPFSQAARLCEQFVLQNNPLFTLLGVQATTHFDGNDLRLKLSSTSTIGAVPLISPTRGTLDYGLVVQPRFSWLGIGPMLSEMGWRITPTPLRLPLLKRSERRVPPWVLSSMILRRLQILLENLQRRFEYVKEIRSSPRGSVHWSEYAVRSMAAAQFLALPCSYPDLRDDRSLKGVIRFALERQLGSLQTQSAYGSHIHKLIDFCNVLLGKVQGVASITPGAQAMQAWQQRPLRGDAFREGIQAIEWTAEDRGLAGLGDLEGIPWAMPMDSFFEAFVETVLRALSRRIGAQLKVGRQRETVQSIAWSPTFSGSQKSLVPDFLLERGDTTFVIDAKYKRHFEELDARSWWAADSELQERHRNDLFQVLAYANLARTSHVVACLVYPCEVDLWEDLRKRGRLFHRAEIAAGTRQISLWLTAIPMGKKVDDIVAVLEVEFRAEGAGSATSRDAMGID
jgi:hypothetical protein